MQNYTSFSEHTGPGEENRAAKHAYLILCHNNLQIVKMLLSALDDPRNDIYIHVDRKVKAFGQWKRELATKKATLVFTKRSRVNWGGSSQIRAEFILLEAATKTEHAYYHLLSGADLPLHSQDVIHAFFENNRGKEFISIDQTSREGTLVADRVGQYHFLQNIIGRNRGIHIAIAERLENLSIAIQKRLGVDRLRRFHGTIYKGANWFSITHPLALYVLARKASVKRRFRFSLCADELFLQTVAMESPYARNVTGDAMRYVDWQRGTPYTFRNEDYVTLWTSSKLFARKFDEHVDMTIVERICNRIRLQEAYEYLA